MTEREWPTTIRFRAMCQFVFDAASRTGLEDRALRWLSGLVWGRIRIAPTRRKLLLLIAECGRHVWQDASARAEKRVWVERAERFADGKETGADREAVSQRCAGNPFAVAAKAFPYSLALAYPVEMWAVIDRIAGTNLPAADDIEEYFGEASESGCAIIRDIFGNPFRPVTFSPSWHTDTAVALARTMYESHDFSAMPILADALQDAGCDNTDVLAHCRDPKQTHVRGCWVVDLVLNKG